jgi:hypothetical protein
VYYSRSIFSTDHPSTLVYTFSPSDIARLHNHDNVHSTPQHTDVDCNYDSQNRTTTTRPPIHRHLVTTTTTTTCNIMQLHSRYPVHGAEPHKPPSVWATQAEILIVPPAPRVLRAYTLIVSTISGIIRPPHSALVAKALVAFYTTTAMTFRTSCEGLGGFLHSTIAAKALVAF